MPPSAHYLNLLNRLPEPPISNEDITKELELFTNTEFLDDEQFYAPSQMFDYVPDFYPVQHPTTLTPGVKRGSEEVETPRGRSMEEEDKRRRNTAASARFRVKKKQREQALQETAKAVQDRNAQLEARVKELELENKWLRGLLRPTSKAA